MMTRQHNVILTWKKDDNIVFIVKSVVQSGLSFGVRLWSQVDLGLTFSAITYSCSVVSLVSSSGS